MNDEDIHFEGKTRYGNPVGRCIYCESDGGEKGLSDEHIIAFSLGVDAFLPEASCQECAGKTSYIEGYAAREIFGSLRIMFGIQSRRKKIELNDLIVVYQTTAGEETRLIPRATLPILHLPILEPAGFFHGLDPAPITKAETWTWYATDIAERMERFRKPGDKSFEFRHTLKFLPFARLLAKTAHAFAVARLGVDSFKPYLPNLILGKDENAAYLVGMAAAPTEPVNGPPGTVTNLHKISLSLMAADGKPTILAATIRLFSFTGAPTYYVVIGEAEASAIEQLNPDAP